MDECCIEKIGGQDRTPVALSLSTVVHIQKVTLCESVATNDQTPCV